MKIPTRTWPYGTRKPVKVLYVEAVELGGRRIPVVALIEQQPPREGFGLIGAGHGAEHAKPGDLGTIIFTRGGPTGGFWTFEPSQPARPHAN